LTECRVPKATLVIAELHRRARCALPARAATVGHRVHGRGYAERQPGDISIMAVVAEEERRATSERPKAALAAAKVNQH
jgi:hypothetical protein